MASSISTTLGQSYAGRFNVLTRSEAISNMYGEASGMIRTHIRRPFSPASGTSSTPSSPSRPVTSLRPWTPSAEERLATPQTATPHGDPLQDEAFTSNAEHHQMTAHLADMLLIYGHPTMEAVSKERAEKEREAILERQAGPFQKKCRKLVRSRLFNFLFSVLISVDTVLLAHSVSNPQEMQNQFSKALLLALTSCFIIELAIRAAADPSTGRTMLLFDVFILILSCVELIELFTAVYATEVNFMFLRVLRIFRLIRIIRVIKPAHNLPVLQFLFETLLRSVLPLLTVLILSGLLVFAFAVMLTSLVPQTVEDGDEAMRREVFEHFGSLGKSMRTLVEVFDGSSSCSMGMLFTLIKQDRPEMIIANVLADFVLALCVSGLVTGVFIEQLFSVTKRLEEKVHREELLQSYQLLTTLDQVFSDMGFCGDHDITWREIRDGLESNETLRDTMDMDVEDARRLFLHIDDNSDGYVGVDEFIFGVFKLKTISKSIDMLSMDYQQEQALRSIAQMHSSMPINVANIQSRLVKFSHMLPEIEKKIKDVTDGIGMVWKLEKELKEEHSKAFKEVVGFHPEEVESSEWSVDKLRSNYHLNGRLSALEKEFTSMQQADEQGLPPATDEAIADIAERIVQSIKQTLQEELIAATTPAGFLN